jgi:uncharacterized protein
VLNIDKAARDVGLDKGATDNYVSLLEKVFLVRRLPAWGKTLDEIRQASAGSVYFSAGLGLVLVKRSDDSLGGSQQAAILDRFRDSAVIEMFAVDYHGD